MLERVQTALGLRRTCKPKRCPGTNSSNEKGVGSLSHIQESRLDRRTSQDLGYFTTRPLPVLPSRFCDRGSEPCVLLGFPAFAVATVIRHKAEESSFQALPEHKAAKAPPSQSTSPVQAVSARAVRLILCTVLSNRGWEKEERARLSRLITHTSRCSKCATRRAQLSRPCWQGLPPVRVLTPGTYVAWRVRDRLQKAPKKSKPPRSLNQRGDDHKA